jgi:hypothetical protein
LAGDALDIALLLQVVDQEMRALRDDRRLEPPDGTRGAALLSHVEDLLGAVAHRMGQNPGPTAPQTALESFAREMRQSVIVLRNAHGALPWVELSKRPSINLGSLYLAEELARLEVGTDVDLVVVPNQEYMYSTSSWPFAAVIRATRGFVERTTRRPIVMNYPLTDDDRVLLHPIFAHELGHASANEHGLVQAVAARFDSDATFVAELTKTVDAINAATGTPKVEISGAIRTVLQRWIEELICDHLALEAMGPAFLWAFAAFALPFTYSEAGPYHPPNTLRIRLALDLLSQRGWDPFMSQVAPGVSAWLDGVAADSAATTGSLDGDFLLAQMGSHAVFFQDAAAARIGSGRLEADKAAEPAKEATSLLERLILPVGFENRIEPRAILLGGWVCGFLRHGDNSRGCAKTTSDRGLQELVGKAIELSTVSAAWESLS